MANQANRRLRLDHTWRRAWTAALAGLALLAAGGGAQAQSVEAFYRGRTVSMIVPADPGGSYDLHTRLIARHLGRFIPGRPTIVVQNMTGAGGLRAINFLYEKAPQDGTVIGMPVQENVLADVLGGPEVRYKVTDFNWIGRLAPGADVIVTWWTSGIRTIADATKVALPVGATGPASGTSLYPRMLNSLVGTRFEVVAGYKHNETLLAMERGETAGAHTSLSTLKSVYPDWIPKKKINMLVVFSPQRLPELGDVPDLVELARDARDRQVMAIFSSVGAVGRSIMTTPHAPAERVAALRAAFSAMVEDADFRADVAKSHAEFGPLAGAALQALIADTRNVPAAVLERARAAVRP
jgi:tripartite-type tricarboxylate transporter receptor subunit TctC